MDRDHIDILLIEDDPWEVTRFRNALLSTTSHAFTLTAATSLSEATQFLSERRFHAVILDLALKDGGEFSILRHIRSTTPGLPVIVITRVNEEDKGHEALRAGADDYIVKGQVDGSLLVRSIRYATERRRMQTASLDLSLVDPLTGLYNDLGFTTLAERQMKLAARSHSSIILLGILLGTEIDNLEGIKHQDGSAQGDQVVRETARLLRRAFRSADILARLGGGEFAILPVDPGGVTIYSLVERIHAKVAEFNASPESTAPFCVSVAGVRWQPDMPCEVGPLLNRARAAVLRARRER
jgi:diguanylate cyclase (GGDEF)-like protein